MAYQELLGGESRLWYNPTTEEIAIGPGTDTSTSPLNGRRSLSDTSDTYVVIASQAGTAAPTVTTLKSITGVTITWARSSEGVYTATADSAIFTSNKTFIRTCSVVANNTGTEFKADCVITSTSILTITVRDSGGTPTDVWGVLYFEVVIYP